MIGVRLKEIRKEKNMTLKELAEGAGVSISFLSQVERGKSSVTLESLRKISEVLGVNPSTFFPSNNEPVSGPSFHYRDLTQQVPNPDFHPILVTLPANQSDGQPFAHSGHEFVYVIEGTLTLQIGTKMIELQQGESWFFSASETHYWYNHTDQSIRFLLVSSR
ncbi:helix-turn-helix domain-containing protein [Mesobacillus jeotgali]|uniref:helix-turn-helix domain-containing protein n=1 Tax=Mesobacillus jeotgali TaxID=129985 RepID=UPI0009A6CEAC|nr:XRE family transcriptional regulator [Mesobacillus jeotgali]